VDSFSDTIIDDFGIGGGGMPQYRTVETEEYKASISPIGIRRFVRSLPYLYGSDVSFKFEFKNKSDSQLDIYYSWSLAKCNDEGPYPFRRGGESDISVPSEGSISRIIYVGYLSLMDYYELKIGFPGFNDTMASFTLMDRDLYMNRWQVGVIGGVVGSVITLVAANLSGC
jgi:hypothetical protein